ncbi:MAG: hypothetical protein IPL95_19495 [Saprospiraceae bacterium]|nr:hypothetical protein [Saprospiraceae bacterium]
MTRLTIKLSLMFSFTLFISILSCKKETTNPCFTTDMSFSKNIVAIYKSSTCLTSGCHSSNDLVPLETYSVTKFLVDQKKLLWAIKREAGFSPMPKVGDKLSDCDISKIEAWINQGAKDN